MPYLTQTLSTLDFSIQDSCTIYRVFIFNYYFTFFTNTISSSCTDCFDIRSVVERDTEERLHGMMAEA